MFVWVYYLDRVFGQNGLGKSALETLDIPLGKGMLNAIPDGLTSESVIEMAKTLLVLGILKLTPFKMGLYYVTGLTGIL